MFNPVKKISEGTKNANALGGLALAISLVALIIVVSKMGKK